MKFAIAPAPYLTTGSSVSLIMRRVLLAMCPGIAVLYAWFGIGVLTNLILASILALLYEALSLRLRGVAPAPFLTDYSALVTAWLLAVSLPPLSPWWLIAIATGVAIVGAKHLYGGLGYNPFNPAMVGYAAVLIAFPAELTSWLLPAGSGPGTPDLATSIAALSGSGAGELDGYTGATALDLMKTELGRGRMIVEATTAPAFGAFGGRGWEWAAVAWLCGGLWLIWKKVVDWRIPVAMLAAIFFMSATFWLVDSQRFASPLFHWFGGATLLGAFFVASDPVSASSTRRGRLLYGAGIGVLVWVIRTWGGYPDGVAFAVLLMNMVAPTIDHYTVPRAYGHSER